MRELQRALRTGDWQVTVAVHEGHEVIAIWPGLHERPLGIAFDVGSTTVAGHLCDLTSGEVLASAGAMNPQIRFGEDLMSRVSYVMMHPGSQADLTAAVRTCLGDLTEEMARDAGVVVEDVLAITLVGNPIMHHLVLGLDPDRARRRAVRAGHRRGGADPGSRAGSRGECRRPRVRLAVHRRACRRGYRGR